MEKVATLSAIPRDRGLAVKLGEIDMLLVRDGATVYAFQGTCPHAGAPLAEGGVCNGRIICPWHKAEFRIADGALLEPPALHGLARYPVTLEGEDVLVDARPLAEHRSQVLGGDKIALIAGAGAAGTAAAVSLREFGYCGRILMLSREPDLPYDRTELSKFVMSGDMKIDDVSRLDSEQFFADQRIERITNEIATLDVAARRVRCRDGAVYPFDIALIATGAAPVRLEVPGVDLGGVHMLRSLGDAAALAGHLGDGTRVVILGSSFVGLEVACGLRARKLPVTVVSPETVPFARQFGSEIGLSIRALHERNGVIFHADTKAVALEGAAQVEHVVLKDGTRLPADLVLMAVGVRPETSFIDGGAREQDGGLRVDAHMRVAEGVFAAGDIAFFPLPHDGGRARIEHWRLAQQQARIAARNMAGGDAVFDDVPFFWTYHYGKRFEYLGHAETWDRILVEGDINSQRFVAILCQRGMVGAIVACDREHETALLAAHMRRKLTVDAALQIIRGGTAASCGTAA